MCDGISGGQIALKEIGIPIRKYFSYEIKLTAIQTTQLNFPSTIQLGDVNEFNISQLDGEQIDLFLCGSPCQDMSLINANKALATTAHIITVNPVGISFNTGA